MRCWSGAIAVDSIVALLAIPAQPDPFVDDFPDVPLKGGYGVLPPPYLNAEWEIGDLPAGGLTRPKREIYNEPPSWTKWFWSQPVPCCMNVITICRSLHHSMDSTAVPASPQGC